MSKTSNRKYATIRHFPDRGCYEVQIRVPGHEQITRTFYDLCKAEEFIENTVPQLVSRKPTQHSRPAHAHAATGPQTFAELLNEPLSKTIEDFLASDRAIDRHKRTCPTIKDNLMGARLCDLDRAWTLSYIARVQKQKTRAHRPFALSTIATHIQIMRLIVNWRAEKQRLPRIEHSLTTTLLPPGWDEERDRLLEDGEEARIRAVIEARPGPAGAQWGHLLTLALETAARLQELILSQWKEFDMKRRVWSIPRHHTKTGQARAIPLSRAATAAAIALREAADGGGRMARVFHELGNPASVSALFHRYTLEAGVEDFRFHDLRHCALTNMVLNKPKLRDVTIMKISGHKELKSFLRYANLRMGDFVDDMD